MLELKGMGGIFVPRVLKEKVLELLSLDVEKETLLCMMAVDDVSSVDVSFFQSFREGVYRIDCDPPIAISIPEEEQARLMITNGIIAECNDTAARMYGYENAAESRGIRLIELLNPDDPHIKRANLKFIRSGYRMTDYENWEKDRYGKGRYFLHTALGIVANGHLVRIWGKKFDITEHKEMEKNLRRALAELKILKKRIEQESSFLQEELRSTHNFEEIIGESRALRDVLYKTEQVALTDATVMIQGETGTGKELIARAIHSLSRRKDRPLLKVNCANFNPHLMESELFGHEKGAFTGAVSMHMGRFEVADGSTIFLDEIGELSFELQSKLLRFLQDGEFERIGGTRTIKVDVRVLAATNRDLFREVQEGRFREDLFYRLNVFPVTIPSLRERREDIPFLVKHYLKQVNKKMGKLVNTVPRETMKELMDYPWPGNIRELQNVIEKAVITTRDSILRVEFVNKLHSSSVPNVSRLEDVERDHILRILKQNGWQVSGKRGIAAILGINPSTLRFRMKKLGITKPSFNR
jgi:PAS domain S-box-containing protein